MNFVFDIDLVDFRKKKDIEKKRLLTELGNKAIEIFKEQIAAVYSINSKFHPQKNYVPLEEMQESISCEVITSPPAVIIFLDESKIEWKDYRGREVHEIVSEEEYFLSKFREKEVRSFDRHWKTPIEGKKENEYFFEKSKEEIKKYISTDFVKQLGGGK